MKAFRPLLLALSAFLAAPEKAYFLYPFIGQERSVAEVAKR